MNVNLSAGVQLRRLIPTIFRCSSRMNILLATVALSFIWVSSAAGACGSAAQRMNASVFAAQPLPLSQQPASDNTSDDRVHGSSDKVSPITGLWRTVYVSEGVVINVGFNIWHSDGTEWALDSISPPFQGNTCAGVWEQIGRRKYKTIHPSFNYDAAGLNVTGVFIERVEVTISADGNSFEGSFTFGNYDLQGNSISATVAGNLTATRIKVGTPSIPIPLK